jgi:hypothetical protein
VTLQGLWALRLGGIWTMISCWTAGVEAERGGQGSQKTVLKTQATPSLGGAPELRKVSRFMQMLLLVYGETPGSRTLELWVAGQHGPCWTLGQPAFFSVPWFPLL